MLPFEPSSAWAGTEGDEGRPAGEAAGRDSLRLFGSPALRHAAEALEEPLDWQRPVALLAYLACRPGWHSREALAEMLRPDASEQAGRAYLRGLLHRTREVFPRLHALRFEEGRVRWCGDSDVQAFEAAAARGDWSRAIALQQQPLLHSVPPTGEACLDDWFHEERLRLQQRLGAALVGSIVGLHAQANVERADLMQRLAEHDPLDESAVQVLLGHARTPRERHAALAAFHTLRRRLTSEFGQDVLPRTLDLCSQLQQAPADAGASAQTPARRAVRQAPLGRARELGQLRDLLASPGARLVTIHGPGGVGKTSLARALHDVARGEDIACAWIDLLAVDTRHGMLDALASQLGVPVREGLVADQLAHWLAARTLVVFLDNMEQLSAEAHVLEDLLRGAPGVRFVLTSRETLGLAGEHLLALRGLACEGADAPAARLFELHAARMGHPVAAGERPYVEELVAYLEGVPLVIELAANWVTVLPVRAILEELRKDPAFIDGIEPESGRSMQRVFAATWQRLDPQEQDALAALSTVRGVIDLRAARAIACSGPSVFLRLVQKSLLQRSEEGTFHMHPLLRGFAAQRSPRVVEQANARHAQHFLTLIAEQPPVRLGRFVREEIERLQPHARDIARAWRCAVDDGRTALLASAMPNLAGFFVISARNEELLDLMSHAARGVPPDFCGRGFLEAARAFASLRLGRMEQADAIARTAMDAEPARSTARAMLGMVRSRVRRYFGEHAAALRFARAALESLEEEESRSAFARMQLYEDLALCHSQLGELAEAESYLVRNLALASRHDARYVGATSLCLLGIVRDAAGAHREALELLESSERMFRDMRDDYQIAYCLRGASYVHLKIGNVQRQYELALEALQAFTAGGHQHEIGESLFAVVMAHDAAGRMEQARETCLQALRHCLREGQVPIALRCIAALGAFAALSDREWGVALMAYVAVHPGRRAYDSQILQARLRRLGVGDGEFEAARARAGTWTFDWVCDELLAAGGACRAGSRPSSS